MNTLTDENLSALIQGLEDYRNAGVYDPWILDNGTSIDPLEVLYELRSFRKALTLPANTK